MGFRRAQKTCRCVLFLVLAHTTEIVTALGLTDKTLTTVDDLLATVLQKADSGKAKLATGFHTF